jgi:fatty acid desaturase
MENTELLRQVQWKDLTKLSIKEMLIENNISIPWALGSWGLAYYGYYWLALPLSAMFFLTALRQVHNGFHNALGTTPFLTWFTMYSNSILMCASIHAVRFNHLRHHKYCLQEEDYEGKSASMTWWQAILYGPVHIFLVHWITLKHGSTKDRWNVMFELFSIAVFVTLVLYWKIYFLLYHIIIMVIGEMLSAFFAVWSVHHDCDEKTIARTQRTGWKNMITYSMFYHLEHHLFPAVPTIKLPILVKRLDEALPDLEKKNTF